MKVSFAWRRRVERSLMLFILVAASVLPAAAQQATGNVGVTVLEQGSGRPVFQAQVSIVNTTLGGVTGQDGKFLIRGVPLGARQVRVLRVGYTEQKKDVVVSATSTVAVEFTLSTVAVQLTPVVTTATGDTRRVEIGNATASIDAGKMVESSPITNMNDLLNAHAAGVLVTPSTQTGSGSRVRIRGMSSVTLNNDPIYVIDGIRMTGGQDTQLSTGDAQASRIGDISPEEIESIEIVKGPSAATLYGTAAANGVIVITTKKGRAGNAQWTVFGESGQMSDRNEYPWNYTIIGHTPGATTFKRCLLPTLSAGTAAGITCIRDSVDTYSPLHDPSATPLGNGYRGQVGVGVRGGTEAVRYNIQASRENETGIFKLPDFEYTMLDTTHQPMHSWLARPNFRDATSVRANISMSPSSKLDVSVNSGFTTLDQRLLQASNATQGLGSQGYGGPGFPQNGFVGSPAPATPLHGYRAWTPAYIYQERLDQGINRFIGSVNVNWRPTTWMQNRMDIGSDLTDRNEANDLFNGEGPPITTTYRNGKAYDFRSNLRNITANVSSTGTWSPRSWLNSKTTIGAQYVDFRQDGNSATGDGLPPGALTAGAGAVQGANETFNISRTLGQYVEEAVSINDRLFLTAAARSDQNSAFGQNFQNVIYPKFSVSWIISEESWFKAPEVLHLDQLRLRYAVGRSGVQPGQTDALRTFQVSSFNIRQSDQSTEVFNSLGNANLKPEVASELETGLEAHFFHGRLTTDLTYYYKYNKDALIGAIVAPSLGTQATTQRSNLGAIRNSGFEAQITAQLLDKPWLGIDANLSTSINQNIVLSLGGTAPQRGVSNWIIAGYPINSLFARHITGWQDKNGDGILTYNADPNLNEVFVSKDTTFRGSPEPTQFAALTLGFDLFRRKLRLSALTDYRGGNLYYNNTERIRCVSRQNCNGQSNPAGSFVDQAMVVGTLNDPSQTLDGFFQPGAFIKLREVSAQYTMPQALATSLKARTAALVLSVRNVAKWTKYRGVDPENDFTGASNVDAPADFQTFGAPTYFILRLNLGF
jgi:TonB-linked SusC/RagA family outer membrane protein